MEPTTTEETLRTVTDGIDVAIREVQVSPATRTYLREVSRTIDLPGVFVHSAFPPAPGTVLALEFHDYRDVASGGMPHALAVVRWRSYVPEWRGMTLDLVELDGLRDRSVAEWLDANLAGPPVCELPPPPPSAVSMSSAFAHALALPVFLFANLLRG